ncbi:MAG TPA: hypothetical protein VIC08_02865 [Cellvibrionaceae bacterium]
MKKKRLPLAMLAALADKSGLANTVILETPETLIYPIGVKHMDENTGTEVAEFNLYLSPMEALL